MPGTGSPAPPPSLLRAASLFLDFDGTLVELAPRPDAVVVGARVERVLCALGERLEGRVAIVSGRPVAEIRGLLGGVRLAVSGSHGLELDWADGRSLTPEPPGWLPAALRRAEALRGRHPGVVIEAKPFGVALHYRQAPAAEADCRALAEQLAGEDRLLQPGKMVFEVRAAGSDKGSALRAFMAEPPMAGSRPVFIGDDATDEPAFAVAAELGGAGILVGPERDSAARFRLEGVAATLDWLEAAAGLRA